MGHFIPNRGLSMYLKYYHLDDVFRYFCYMQVYNFKQVSDQLACSGQPREGQLDLIAGENYRVIINLGLADAKYSLKDERASVEALGMTYHHIPVAFEDPQPGQLQEFIGLMNVSHNEKVLVHCAANYRASAFTGLYLLSAKTFNKTEMHAFIEDVWQPDAIWEQFIEECSEMIG